MKRENNINTDILIYYIIKVLSFVLFVLVLLLCVALLTLWERKILGLIQRRKGPNVVGYCGVLQPFSDGIKLLLKESVVPSRANKYLFLLAPALALTFSFLLWAVIPVGTYIHEENEVSSTWSWSNIIIGPIETVNDVVQLHKHKDDDEDTVLGLNLAKDQVYMAGEPVTTVDLNNTAYLGSILNTNIGLLMILAILSLNTYPVILGGWASNSKYAFLGALRASAQMISYEIAMSLTVLPVCVLSGSSNLNDIIQAQSVVWNIFILPLSFILFFICVLAETYRTPFDFTEAEGELVSGFNVEYSSMGFALFFLAEYLNIIFMCGFMSVLFFGGLKVYITLILLFFIILIRGTLPRYRYDQLMRLGWRIIMPISVIYLVIISTVFFFFF